MKAIVNAVAAACWVLLAACTPLAPEYSIEAYGQATCLKAQSLALIVEATGPIGPEQARIDSLRLDVDSAYEFAHGLPNNEIVSQQWALMRDPNGKLLFGLLRHWEAHPAGLGASFVNEARGEIGGAFDTIICLEINKRAANAC